jgi:hypothetical protein
MWLGRRARPELLVPFEHAAVDGGGGGQVCGLSGELGGGVGQAEATVAEG